MCLRIQLGPHFLVRSNIPCPHFSLWLEEQWQYTVEVNFLEWNLNHPTITVVLEAPRLHCLEGWWLLLSSAIQKNLSRSQQDSQHHWRQEAEDSVPLRWRAALPTTIALFSLHWEKEYLRKNFDSLMKYILAYKIWAPKQWHHHVVASWEKLWWGRKWNTESTTANA